MSEMDLKRFFLEQVPLFTSFSADKVEEIVIKSRLATFEGNEAMLETGDEGHGIGIMISGHADISTSDNTGTRTVIAQLGSGDVFGIMSVLTGNRIVADVIAGNRCFRADDPAGCVQRPCPDQSQGHCLSVPPARRAHPGHDG
jgi:acetate kinase